MFPTDPCNVVAFVLLGGFAALWAWRVLMDVYGTPKE